MAKKVKITFKKPPEGFTEIINNGAVQSLVADAAQGVAARATGMVENGSFHVEQTTGQFAQDAAYGASRPVAFVIADDEETAAEEAENKILSKAL